MPSKTPVGIPSFKKDIKLSMDIMRANQKFRTRGVPGKVKSMLIFTGLYPALKQIKDRIY